MFFGRWVCLAGSLTVNNRTHSNYPKQKICTYIYLCLMCILKGLGGWAPCLAAPDNRASWPRAAGQHPDPIAGLSAEEPPQAPRTQARDKPSTASARPAAPPSARRSAGGVRAPSAIGVLALLTRPHRAALHTLLEGSASSPPPPKVSSPGRRRSSELHFPESLVRLAPVDSRARERMMRDNDL